LSTSTFHIPDSRRSPPIVWRSLLLRLVLGAFPIWSAGAVLTSRTGWQLKLMVGALATVTLAKPAAGLSVVAAVVPLATVIATSMHLEGYRIGEMLVMTCLAAWLLRAGADRRGPRLPPAMSAAGWLLALATLTSVAVLAWRMREFPDELAFTLARLRGAYFLFPDRIGFVDGARLLEGLGMTAAALHLFRQQPALAVRLPAVLCAGGAAAATMSVLISRGIGPAALVNPFTRLGYRSAYIYDVNAAASYFVLMLWLAIGMGVRARRRSRAPWTIAAALNGTGLWFSHSRSATAALVIAVMLMSVWLATAAWTGRARAAVLTLVIVLALAGSFVRARLLELDPTFRGGGLREQFYATSLRMIAARPLSGVGIGQYARESALFLTPQLAWTYGSENAHNYFLQIGSELGVPGLTFLVIWIGSGIVVMARSLTHAADARLLGASTGILAFVLTCLTGHPLLVGEAGFPFWIAFGLTVGLAASPFATGSTAAATAAQSANAVPSEGRAQVRSRLSGLATAARLPAAVALASVVVGAGFLSAAAGPLEPPKSQAVDGFYAWETTEDGRRFRWSGMYGSLFVPADVKRVRIPIRLPIESPALAPMAVGIVTGGVDQGQVLVGSAWDLLEVRLPEAPPPVRFKRIDLKMARTWQPALYIAGSYDMRPVGVQVGECELLR
jgi:O-antigen ligase